MNSLVVEMRCDGKVLEFVTGGNEKIRKDERRFMDRSIGVVIRIRLVYELDLIRSK